jgi:hypothetical protein
MPDFTVPDFKEIRGLAVVLIAASVPYPSSGSLLRNPTWHYVKQTHE